jgi:hypothetical protein
MNAPKSPEYQSTEYLQAVVRAVATFGHRDVVHFENAFSKSQWATRSGLSNEDMALVAEEVRQIMKLGVDYYEGPSADWFDSVSCEEFKRLANSKVVAE